MGLERATERYTERYIPNDNNFFRNYYHIAVAGLCGLIVLLIIVASILFYQISHRPLPLFSAIQPNGDKMTLSAFDQPNMLPSTLLQWAGKAATAAYTFDFYNYEKQLAALRPYFTEEGWQDYLSKVTDVLAQIKQRQLFVNGVISGTPVIANEGPLPGKSYVWRIQIPYLVTYQAATVSSQQKYTILITLVRKEPTALNPQGIGIDQFVMG